MELRKITTGLFWIAIPEKDFYLMCGCPMDSIKHLTNEKIIRPVEGASPYTETGPNGILLSDLAVQNGYFCNMAEFPILHMMYKQGMALPNHPAWGRKPWIIGTEEQVTAQKNYIFRGNYGLASPEEFRCAGCREESSEQIWRLKLLFNNGEILKPEELIETTVIDAEPVELKPGIFLERRGVNLYRLSCGDESAEIDLNIREEEEYEPPYTLDFHKIRREHFSVIHVGEGNGWDNTRPCMGSLLTYKGKFYLIDAGPNIEYSLNALGISVNDIEGLFHTHIHDDHFAGLTYLVMADHKIRYFATPAVMETAKKKLSALMGQEESLFEEVFETVPLNAGRWNDREGLQIKPVFSPHPVETTIFYFRVAEGEGYRSYAHLADIVTKSVLDGFVSEDPARGISREWSREIWEGYREKADIKKIDVGGGFVHGSAEDFREDPSDLLLLSHTDRPLRAEELPCGTTRTFGAQDTLIPARKDYRTLHALEVLTAYFPGVPERELALLIRNRQADFPKGTLLARKGENLGSVYLILSGKIQYLLNSRKAHLEMTAGSMIGITNSLWGKPAVGNYTTATHVETLKIPTGIMISFLEKNGLLQSLRDISRIVRCLKQSTLFGSHISSPKLVKLAQDMTIVDCSPGETVSQGWPKDLYFIDRGEVEILREGRVCRVLRPGETWGGYPVYPIWEDLDFTARAAGGTAELFRFSAEALQDIPVIQWKLYQIWSCWAAEL